MHVTDRTIAGFIVYLIVVFMMIPLVQAEDSHWERLAAEVDREAADKRLPQLSMVLVDEAGIVWSHGFVDEDSADDDTDAGVTADGGTTYRIGSVSKLFTDIAVMQMVEAGTLDLDAPVLTYLPDFHPDNPFSAPITLRTLMSHSSGLVREPQLGNYFDSSEPTLAATVRSLNDTTLDYEPGSRVQYSNAGIAVVGRILEVVAGKPFAEVLESRVLRPLGMQHSDFMPREDLVAKLPQGWMWRYEGDRSAAPTFELGESPAGSMYASINDLALFIGALIDKGEGRDGRILNESTLQQMWTPQSEVLSLRGRSFGIGFGLGELDGNFAVAHGGAIYGFATQLKVLPERGVGVAISTNLDTANGVVNRIADHALRVLVAVKEGRPAPQLPASAPLTEKQLALLPGVYRNADETVEIVSRSGDLYAERVGGLSLRLRRSGEGIVIDDLMLYSDEVSLADDAISVFGTTYSAVDEGKPAPLNAEYAQLIGEYGPDHNVLFISEKDGRLHALIEWGFQYPLEHIEKDKFRFPAYGLYPNETLNFQRDEDGAVVLASLNGVVFERRPVGLIDNGIFRIDAVAPVEDLLTTAMAAEPPQEPGDFRDADLVDVTHYSDTIRLDIRYASEQNFLGTPVYSSAQAFLQRPAAEALGRVSARLADEGYGLMVHDAYRPWYVTKVFWDATPVADRKFVADPAQGSRHNRGCAIDLTLYDLETGEPVEMVGVYDEMSDRSSPYYPGGSSLQRWRRDLLKRAMEAEGFEVYAYEWWHFDYEGWQNYRILNQTFEQLNATGDEALSLGVDQALGMH
jgi:CubicO group peptidase (beta-lactamase class C family)/D-alanyl-D-alanine dipeptidase